MLERTMTLLFLRCRSSRYTTCVTSPTGANNNIKQRTYDLLQSAAIFTHSQDFVHPRGRRGNVVCGQVICVGRQNTGDL